MKSIRSSKKIKKIVKPLSVEEIKSHRVANFVQIGILCALLLFMTLDTVFGWKSPLYISLLIFGASFILKKVLEKYILPKAFAKRGATDDRSCQLHK